MEISIHSAFSNFQHYIMDFSLALSYILYWDFFYTFQYVYLGIFPILVYIYIYIWVCSCSPLSLHVGSFLLSYYIRSYIYILTSVTRINWTHIEKQSNGTRSSFSISLIWLQSMLCIYIKRKTQRRICSWKSFVCNW